MEILSEKRLEIGLDNTIFLWYMSLTVNMDGGIRLNISVKAKRPGWHRWTEERISFGGGGPCSRIL